MNAEIQHKREKWYEAVKLLEATKEARELAWKAMNAATAAVTQLKGIENVLGQECQKCFSEYQAIEALQAETAFAKMQADLSKGEQA